MSWAGTTDGWEISSRGVFATEDAGHSWHKIYPQPATAIQRLSAAAGVIEVGVAP